MLSCDSSPLHISDWVIQRPVYFNVELYRSLGVETLDERKDFGESRDFGSWLNELVGKVDELTRNREV